MGDRVARGEAEQALGPLYEGPHVTSRGSEWCSSKTHLRERLLWWQAVQERDKMAGRQEATECQRGDGEVRAGPEAGEVLGGSRSLADTTCVWAEFTSKRGKRRSFGVRKGPCLRIHVTSKGTALLGSRANASPGGRGPDLVWRCGVRRRASEWPRARHPEGAQRVSFKLEAFGNQ